MLPQVRAAWLKIALDTAPVDHAKVRKTLARLYAAVNRPAPRQIIHLDSPFQISNAIARVGSSGNHSGEQVTGAVCGEVYGQLRKRATDRVKDQATTYFGDALPLDLTNADLNPGFRVRLQVGQQVVETTRNQSPGLRPWPFGNDFGQFDVALAWFDFVSRLGLFAEELNCFMILAGSCGWAVLFWDYAFISAKPKCFKHDQQHRLHCETGAAVRYSDGFSVFAIHGIRVPGKVVAAPESLTVREIESETNVEVRRVMIQRYGLERFLVDGKAEEIHRDDFGILYRKQLPNDEPVLMVKVVNSTPEPDGSVKDYFLRVPPTMERARQAVAWTFGKDENDYAPTLQT